jgi:hypothetical protein
MMLANLKPAGSSPSTMLTVAKRALNATSGQFQPINANSQVVLELSEDRILVGGLTELDGQYIILVTPPKTVAQGEIVFPFTPSNGLVDTFQSIDLHQGPLLQPQLQRRHCQPRQRLPYRRRPKHHYRPQLRLKPREQPLLIGDRRCKPAS